MKKKSRSIKPGVDSNPRILLSSLNMRPVYCKESDRANEGRVLARLVAALDQLNPGKNHSLRASDKFDHFDGTVLRDGADWAIAEVKNRTGSGERFSTWHISVKKFNACCAIARERNVKFFLVFSWDGEIFCCDGLKVAGFTLRFSEGGRRDRGDEADIETMMHIPREIFFRVGSLHQFFGNKIVRSV